MDPLCDHLLMSRKKDDGTEEDVGTLRWCVLKPCLLPLRPFTRVDHCHEA